MYHIYADHGPRHDCHTDSCMPARFVITIGHTTVAEAPFYLFDRRGIRNLNDQYRLLEALWNPPVAELLTRILGANPDNLTFGQRNERIAALANRIGYTFTNLGPDGFVLEKDNHFIFCPHIMDVVRSLVELQAGGLPHAVKFK